MSVIQNGKYLSPQSDGCSETVTRHSLYAADILMIIVKHTFWKFFFYFKLQQVK